MVPYIQPTLHCSYASLRPITDMLRWYAGSTMIHVRTRRPTQAWGMAGELCAVDLIDAASMCVLNSDIRYQNTSFEF